MQRCVVVMASKTLTKKRDLEMEYVLLGIGMILMLVAFVCCILVIVKMFQNNQTGLGIGTIVGLFVCGIGYILALIFGWKNKEAWKLEKVMPIFTISLILGLVLYGAGYAILLPKLAIQIKDLQQQQMQQQMQQDMQQPMQPGFPAPTP